MRCRHEATRTAFVAFGGETRGRRRPDSSVVLLFEHLPERRRTPAEGPSSLNLSPASDAEPMCRPLRRVGLLA